MLTCWLGEWHERGGLISFQRCETFAPSRGAMDPSYTCQSLEVGFRGRAAKYTRVNLHEAYIYTIILDLRCDPLWIQLAINSTH